MAKSIIFVGIRPPQFFPEVQALAEEGISTFFEVAFKIEIFAFQFRI